jgi:hypothetical protein
MTEDLEVLVEEPIQILALLLQCSHMTFASFGIVRRRIGVI